MTGTRAQIFAQIDTRLTPLATTYERMPSGDPDVFPALASFDGGHTIVETEAGATRYQIGVTIEGYVEGGDGAAAHDELMALYEAAKAALITEPPLGGVAETIDEGDLRTDVADLASKRRLGFAFDLDIIFVTARGAGI